MMTVGRSCSAFAEATTKAACQSPKVNPTALGADGRLDFAMASRKRSSSRVSVYPWASKNTDGPG